MKRFLWLMCMSCSIAALGACGSSAKKSGDGGVEDGGGNSPDGATTQDLSTLQKQADATKKKADDLAMQLSSVTTDVKTNATELAALDKRVKTLETPITPPAPLDGIALAQAGILDLVMKACTYEGTCCDADELKLKYGPTIQSSQDCIDTFNDLVAKGVNPSFLQSSVPIVQYVVSLAQALSSSEIKVELNKTAIQACTDWLDQRECNKYVAPVDGENAPTYCTPIGDVVVNPCNVEQLLTGMQDKGEVCGIIYGVGGCKDGLVCRSQNGSRGICTEPLGVGGRCLSDDECGGELFCNLTMGQCQARGDEGADCEYYDPSFTYSNYTFIFPPQSAMSMQPGLAIQCKPGLECQPTTKKCIKPCADGSICGNGLTCPDGMVCNFTEVPTLYSNPSPAVSYNLGVCRAPTAAGDSCTVAGECSSGNCMLMSGGTYVCGDPKKAAGDACTAAGADATCSTDWCGTDLKCVGKCKYDPMVGDYTGCPANFYCETQQSIPGNAGTEYACEPFVVDGGACSPAGTGDRHTLCTSGFCDFANTTAPGHTYGTCTAKRALGGQCTTPYASQQCQSTQWCDPSSTPTAYTCVDVVAPGADCSTKMSGCGVGNYCYYDAAATPQYQCRTPGAEGATCVNSGQDCKDPLTCAADLKCHEPGKYPDGVPCSGMNSTDCLNGWCSGVGTTAKPYVCMAPLAEGADCDTADSVKDTCVETSFCAHPADSTAGTCTKQHMTGQACEPRYGGGDCLNSSPGSSPCVLANGVFVCNTQSLAPETVLCDGT